MKENMKNILMNIRSIFRNNYIIYWCRLFILSVMASYHFRWYINNMFSVGCRRATLFYCERLRFQEASYKNRTFHFMPSSTTFGSCSQHMRMVLWQPLVQWTRSHPKPLLVQWTRSSYSKIYRITFSPMSRKWCGLSSKIDPLFRLNLTHPNIFRVWVSFFIISDFYTVIWPTYVSA